VREIKLQREQGQQPLSKEDSHIHLEEMDEDPC